MPELGVVTGAFGYIEKYISPLRHRAAHFGILKRHSLQQHRLADAQVSNVPDFRDRPVPGSAVYVEDLASIAAASACEPESRVLDAIGPEAFSFEELVALIGAEIGRNVRPVHLAPALGIFLGQIIG